MEILLVKTSSLGDVLHTLPALTELGRHVPGARVTWVVEEAFAEIPLWHPLVKNVIPIAWRRWRKKISAKENRQQFFQFLKKLRKQKFDVIIDAQGLLKSAVIARLARGKQRIGYSKESAREGVSSWLYQNKIVVKREQHAIQRVRQLFAQSFSYPYQDSMPDYGLNKNLFAPATEKYMVFLHGTTWETKLWPEKYWQQLARMATERGWVVKLLWGNEEEHARALRLSEDNAQVEVLPRMNLQAISQLLAGARAVVAVDTGLAHLATALDVPTIGLYGPTNVVLTGTYGPMNTNLASKFACAPCLLKRCNYAGESEVVPACFQEISPARVWQSMEAYL